MRVTSAVRTSCQLLAESGDRTMLPRAVARSRRPGSDALYHYSALVMQGLIDAVPAIGFSPYVEGGMTIAAQTARWTGIRRGWDQNVKFGLSSDPYTRLLMDRSARVQAGSRRDPLRDARGAMSAGLGQGSAQSIAGEAAEAAAGQPTGRP